MCCRMVNTIAISVFLKFSENILTLNMYKNVVFFSTSVLLVFVHMLGANVARFGAVRVTVTVCREGHVH